ncbi:hypothetical protein HRI_004496200 [Hibiscus trionum]|uniref:Glutathione reductase n=1 Tax=Hibiscus trionum TaxID=183268 RepID=A0A9W7J554_HIBTR|nr:hypothetical protein HRI_004496200 [Hibiscus trionum]
MARKMLVDEEMNQSNQEETHYDFDLFVIGAGSGGVRAARFSTNFGAKVSQVSGFSYFKQIRFFRKFVNFLIRLLDKYRFSYIAYGDRF